MRMSDLIEDAVEVLRHLPENVQEAAARAIINYGASHDDDLRLSDAQAIEVERRMADPDRVLLSIDEVRQRLRTYGI
jgi:hypothetical protein